VGGTYRAKRIGAHHPAQIAHTIPTTLTSLFFSLFLFNLPAFHASLSET
jgi:hypothetical protein